MKLPKIFDYKNGKIANASIIVFLIRRIFDMENFNQQNKKDRQLNNLIHLVENHTRTQRHLEQYSHIGDPNNKEHARKIQKIREEEMNDLCDKLNGNADIQTKEEQIENLKQKYESTQEYLHHNKEDMDTEMLQNLQQKQEKRKIQLNQLKDY